PTSCISSLFFLLIDPLPSGFHTLALHDALPILIDSIEGAEPIGPKALFDILVVAPCTGNTVAKLVHGITDTPVTMAVKSHLRGEDRKSTRLNSSHVSISYAVFCLKKKNNKPVAG